MTTYQTIQVSVTNDEMKNLEATPKELIPAQGAGQVIHVLSAMIFFDHTADYSNVGGNLDLRYADTAIQLASGPAGGFLDQGGDYGMIMDTNVGGGGAQSKADLDNKGIKLAYDGAPGELGDGNAANVVRVNVNYMVYAAGW